MWNKHDIISLPTERQNAIGLCKRKDNGKILLYPSTAKDHKEAEYMHLYILSDDEIKEGDHYVYWIQPRDVKIATKKDESIFIETPPVKYAYKKVIASTDESLGLHYIKDSFIEEWVKNPVTEVEVKYDDELIIQKEADYFNYDDGKALNMNYGKPKLFEGYLELKNIDNNDSNLEKT